MKLLSIICILIITALNMVPCADVHDEKVISCSIAAADADNSPGSSHEDYCTPFCHCGCCGSHVITISRNCDSTFGVLRGNRQLFYIIGHFFNADRAVWQPPKLTS